MNKPAKKSFLENLTTPALTIAPPGPPTHSPTHLLTCPPVRGGKQEGADYIRIPRAQFQQLINQVSQIIRASCPAVPPTDIEIIQQTVAGYCDITVQEMLQKSRRDYCWRARAIAMFLGSRLTMHKPSRLAVAFRRHQRDLYYALRAISDSLANNPKFRAEVQALETQLRITLQAADHDRAQHFARARPCPSM